MECRSCMKEVPEESRYCMYCGTLLETSDTADAEEVFVSFEDRIPCSDGNCIGTIENGKCTVCGKPEGEEAS